jgi:hypothetical protein
MIQVDELSDPVVRAFVGAINAGDREAFFGTLTADATMSDVGSSLVANYTNATYASMRTKWRFEVEGDKVSRFKTGQA